MNEKTRPERGSDEWAIQDSNLGPLPYQGAPEYPGSPPEGQLPLWDGGSEDCRRLDGPDDPAHIRPTTPQGESLSLRRVQPQACKDLGEVTAQSLELGHR